MEGKASVKVPNGKLVKTEVEYNNVFENVKIRGDFFIEPPNALHKIEEKIEGLKVESDEETIIEEIEDIDAELIGFSAHNVANTVKQAVGDEE